MNRNAQVRVGSIAALAIAFAIPACSSTSTPNGEPPLPTLPAPSTTSALPVSPATPSLDPRAVRIGEGQWAGKTAAERKKSCLRYTTYPGAYRRGFLGPPNDPINPPAGITPQEAWDSWEYILLRECPGATPTANASRQPGQVNEEFLEAFRRIDDQSTIDVTVDQFCGWWTDPSSNETDSDTYTMNPARSLMNFAGDLASQATKDDLVPFEASSLSERDAVASLNSLCGQGPLPLQQG